MCTNKNLCFPMVPEFRGNSKFVVAIKVILREYLFNGIVAIILKVLLALFGY